MDLYTWRRVFFSNDSGGTLRYYALLIVFFVIIFAIFIIFARGYVKLAYGDRESNYYILLDSSSVNMDVMIRYIQIYLQYKGEEIPDEDWEFICEHTNERYLGDIKNNFINKAERIDNNAKHEYDSGIEYDVGNNGGGLGYEEIERKDNLVGVHYNYNKNSVIAEIVSSVGKYTLTFNLDKSGKVVNISD